MLRYQDNDISGILRNSKKSLDLQWTGLKHATAMKMLIITFSSQKSLLQYDPMFLSSSL